MFKNILWVTDFSPHAADAGRQALECALCSHASVDVLTVVDPEDLPADLLDAADPFVSANTVVAVERRLTKQHEDRVRAHLHREIEFLRDAGVSVQLHVRAGQPSEEIVAAARDLGSEIIVMGAHGKRGLASVLLGNTVEGVTKRADRPVLVVR